MAQAHLAQIKAAQHRNLLKKVVEGHSNHNNETFLDISSSSAVVYKSFWHFINSGITKFKFIFILVKKIDMQGVDINCKSYNISASLILSRDPVSLKSNATTVFT
jgi:hypothetical protein